MRARAHPRREDAFQQLVGHAVQEVAGLRTHVASTAGRDGSIDIYIDASADAQETFHGWPLPLILECKDHDEAGRDLGENVAAGWRVVRDKLTRRAAEGWSGDFAPWRRARTYLYCISARLPRQAAREALQGKIEEHFRSFTDGVRPPIETVAVLDWSDLRGWLDRLPRVADAWLGVRLETVVGHEQFLAELEGFRRYLLPEALGYVPPGPDAETHPDRLFDAVTGRARAGGILLVGAGGVGKTRLALEVATRAFREGWRVLHVRSGDAGLETEDLAEAVLAQDSRTLLVLDYLDQMSRLDPAALRNRLLPEARRRGQTLAVLATARPGAAALDNPEWQALLSRMELDPPAEHVERITARMRSTLAPRAEALLGRERLRQLCGRRPILALFLSRELELRAEEGRLDEHELAGLREGDLLIWLRKRLEESGLAVSPARGLLPVDPEEAVVASAAVLAAAPQGRFALVAAAERLLRSRPHLAGALVDGLARFGWLEPSAGEWSAAHDVVADEVLEQVVRLLPGKGLRPWVLRAILDAALGKPRTLGRYAVALRRLVLASGDEPRFAEALAGEAGEWFRGGLGELGPALAEADADEASYALGAILAGPPWDDLALESWDALLAPWLERWGSDPSARHLLYVGLRRVEALPPRLVEQALSWLETNGHDRNASFVLSRLLKRIDAVQGERTTRYALAWLIPHGEALEAGFVLQPLLDWSDLPAEMLREAVRQALRWLERNGEAPEARFILPPLLDRSDLSAEGASESVRQALRWLERNGETLEAGFVLHPLLDRSDLSAETLREAVRQALRWLERNGEALEAGFVLHPLLERSDLSAETSREAVHQALRWLERNGAALEAQFVLNSLLDRSDLSAEMSSEAVRQALRWLEGNGEAFEARFVLAALLAREDLGGPHETAVISAALGWLRTYFPTTEAEFVFRHLFTRPGLTSEDRVQSTHLALARAETLVTSTEASYLLRWVLADRNLSEAQLSQAVPLGLAWCEHNLASPDLDYVLNPMLRRKSLSDPDWQRAVQLALAWLRCSPRRSDRDFLLVSCLSRPRMLAFPELEEIVHEVITWIREFGTNDRDRDRLDRAVRHALSGADRLGEGAQAREKPRGPQAEKLILLARAPVSMPDLPLLAAGLVQAADLLRTDHPGATGYFLVPLLPLSARWGDAAQRDEVLDLARRMLADPALTPRQRAGFARECLRLLADGAWPDAEAGRAVLRDLGIGTEALTPTAADPLPPLPVFEPRS